MGSEKNFCFGNKADFRSPNSVRDKTLKESDSPLARVSNGAKGDLSHTTSLRDKSLTGLTSARVVRNILTVHHLRLKKRFGQNFLVDRNILNKILEAAEFKREDLVIEIGAGLGTLTQAIAPQVRKLWAIEIDRGLVEVLKEIIQPLPNVEIIHGDALKIKFRPLITKEFKCLSSDLKQNLKIIGNVPYSVTTPLVRKILEDEPDFRRAWLVLPEGVVKRMKASPGTKTYGAFSILVAYYGEVKLIRKIPPQAFFPVPKVASYLVKLERFEERRFKPKSKELFFGLVQAAFKKRRKKLSNSLEPFLEKRKEALLEIQKNTLIDLNRRGETLSIEEFVKLADCLAECKKTVPVSRFTS